MKIDIKATNLELTDEIRDYLNKKIGDIDNFLRPTEFPISARVELGRTTFHHKSGDIYRAEINLQVPGELLRAESESETLFSAIDALKDQIQREIKKYKEKNIAKNRKGDRIRKFLTTYSLFSRFKE